MKVAPEDRARVRKCLDAVMDAAVAAEIAPDTHTMQQRLNTLWAATRRAQEVIGDVEATTRERAIKALENA